MTTRKISLSDKEREILKHDEDNYTQFLTTDPLRMTLRGAAQVKRQQLNKQIFKNLRLRDGAEKMVQAMDGQRVKNKTIQETLLQEISLYDSRLEVLYNELANLRSSFDIYQSAKRTGFPMIAISLKDTLNIEWRGEIEEMIQHHYNEDPKTFHDEIERLIDLRKKVQMPERNENGVKLLYEYYNQLIWLEKRMFTNQKFSAIQFTWFDSLTAHQTANESIAYEKASILFNIGVLWTQIAAAKEFNSETKSTQEAITSLQKAAGIFTYLKRSVREKFSKDLTKDVLEILEGIFKLQAQECILNSDMQEPEKEDVQSYNILAREAAQLSGRYEALTKSMSEVASIPPSWSILAEVKSLHFKATCHYYAALILLQNCDPEFTDCENNTFDKEQNRLSALIELNKIATWLMNEDSRTNEAKSHMKKALMIEETATEITKNDRFINKLSCVHKALHTFSTQIKNKLSSVDVSGNLGDIEPANEVNCSTDRKDKIIEPEVKKYPVQDMFAALGPVVAFNSKIKYHSKKTVTLNRNEHEGLGISIRGVGPTIISKLNQRAQDLGVRAGDVIISVGDFTVKHYNYKQVSQFIQKSGQSVTLTLMSPVLPNVILNVL